jgi:hypothetical protein
MFLVADLSLYDLRSKIARLVSKTKFPSPILRESANQRFDRELTVNWGISGYEKS